MPSGNAAETLILNEAIMLCSFYHPVAKVELVDEIEVCFQQEETGPSSLRRTTAVYSMSNKCR